jgi:O-antigen ligase
VAVSSFGLLALGGWSLLSTQWGGLPQDAWTFFDESIVATSALLVASAVSSMRLGRVAVLGGVFFGLLLHTGEVLLRVAISGGPDSWFFGRLLEGPVGYHNAEAMFFVLGVLPSLVALRHARPSIRAAGGACCGIFLGALVLTQSRGGLVFAALAALVLIAYARDVHLLLLAPVLVAATAALLVAVRDVDAALVDGSPSEHVSELRTYVLWTVVAALALAVVGLAAGVASKRGRTTALAIAAVSVLLIGGAALVSRDAIERAIHRATATASDRSNPDTAPGGATRLASLSLNGRREAWRVAWNMTEDKPLAGHGQGQFTRHWGTDRKQSYFYFSVLQPHSIEMELLSELGVVGLGLFGVFVGAAVVGIVRSRSRTSAAVALALLVALLAGASVDWIWSFPGLVLPVVLVAGAAAGGVRLRRRAVAALVGVAALIAAAVALGGPYLSDRQLDRARAVAVKDPNKAWTLALDARSLDPWDPRVPAFQGKLAQASGDVVLAAEKYAKSATLSRQPWIQYFQEARVFQDAHRNAARKRACRKALATNPTEQTLRWIVCDNLG